MRAPLLFAALLLPLTLAAQPSPQTLAPTPPMGWNSWDSYGITIDEASFRTASAWVAQHLKPAGYEYVTIDEEWFVSDPVPAGSSSTSHRLMDANGRYLPAPNRFPSAANGAGFAPLADYIHSLGLNFGIHVLQGIPKEAVAANLPIEGSSFHAKEGANVAAGCPWNPDNFDLGISPAGQAYYDSIVRLYASWHVDLIKIDCIASRPYKGDEVRMFHEAIAKSGRSIVLSLSPGEAPHDEVSNLQAYAQQWRISDDIWDLWHSDQPYPQGLNDQFPRAAKWSRDAATTDSGGHWPDADMLPLGRLGPAPGFGKARDTRLTHDEQRTLINLWSIFRSPLMYGGDPASTDPWTLSLLTNPEIIELDRHSRHNRSVLLSDALSVWTADPASGPDHYLAVFNREDKPQAISMPWTQAGLRPGTYLVHDLWSANTEPPQSMLHMTLAPHASAILRLSPQGGASQADILAPTPPMGWNSWDSYGTTITEAEYKANVDYLAAHLKPFGYQYATVDIEWYTPHPPTRGSYIPDPKNVTLDPFGRFIPAPNRFPSATAAAGFRPLSDYAHAHGLKFGIHIMRGVPRDAVDRDLPIEGTSFHAADIADKPHSAPWKGMTDTFGIDMSKPGAQAYYDSIARLYASWGVDYIKADDMSAPFHAEEIHALSTAIAKTARPIVLSLSPGATPLAQHAQLREDAQLWRISGDFWDRWPDIQRHFELMKAWQPYVEQGHWPDADMLPLGHIALRGENGFERQSSLTHDEQRTLINLWAVFRSPLIMGGDLPSLASEADHWTLSLLTNPEVIELDQHSQDNKCIKLTDALGVWTAKAVPRVRSAAATPDHYLAIFNREDQSQTVDMPFAEAGLPGSRYRVHDLWSHERGGEQTSLQLTLAPHASTLLRLSEVHAQRGASGGHASRSTGLHVPPVK